MPTTDAGYYQNGGALCSRWRRIRATGLISAGGHSYGNAFRRSNKQGYTELGVFELEKENRASHAFLVFNIDAMRQRRDYDAEMDDYIDNIKNSPKEQRAARRIMMPGEIEWTKKAKAQKSGIELSDDVVASLEQLEKSSGLKINWK